MAIPFSPSNFDHPDKLLPKLGLWSNSAPGTAVLIILGYQRLSGPTAAHQASGAGSNCVISNYDQGDFEGIAFLKVRQALQDSFCSFVDSFAFDFCCKREYHPHYIYLTAY